MFSSLRVLFLSEPWPKTLSQPAQLGTALAGSNNFPAWLQMCLLDLYHYAALPASFTAAEQNLQRSCVDCYVNAVSAGVHSPVRFVTGGGEGAQFWPKRTHFGAKEGGPCEVRHPPLYPFSFLLLTCYPQLLCIFFYVAFSNTQR